jgi:hypothetical protein
VTDHPDRTGKPPDKQWWVISGADLMNALHHCRQGEDLDLVYLECIANSDHADDTQQ